MSIRGLTRTLFHGSASRRPEIEAMLDAELEHHEQVMNQLLRYAFEHPLENGPQHEQDAGTA